MIEGFPVGTGITKKQPVDMVPFFIEAVIAQFIGHIQENEQTTHDPYGETGNIDDGISLLPEDVPQGNQQIIS
jgi:hypothetical protein